MLLEEGGAHSLTVNKANHSNVFFFKKKKKIKISHSCKYKCASISLTGLTSFLSDFRSPCSAFIDRKPQIK